MQTSYNNCQFIIHGPININPSPPPSNGPHSYQYPLHLQAPSLHALVPTQVLMNQQPYATHFIAPMPAVVPQFQGYSIQQNPIPPHQHQFYSLPPGFSPVPPQYQAYGQLPHQYQPSPQPPQYSAPGQLPHHQFSPQPSQNQVPDQFSHQQRLPSRPFQHPTPAQQPEHNSSDRPPHQMEFIHLPSNFSVAGQNTYLYQSPSQAKPIKATRVYQKSKYNAPTTSPCAQRPLNPTPWPQNTRVQAIKKNQKEQISFFTNTSESDLSYLSFLPKHLIVFNAASDYLDLPKEPQTRQYSF